MTSINIATSFYGLNDTFVKAFDWCKLRMPQLGKTSKTTWEEFHESHRPCFGLRQKRNSALNSIHYHIGRQNRLQEYCVVGVVDIRQLSDGDIITIYPRRHWLNPKRRRGGAHFVPLTFEFRSLWAENIEHFALGTTRIAIWDCHIVAMALLGHRHGTATTTHKFLRKCHVRWNSMTFNDLTCKWHGAPSVSYTHLTLPTILLV